MNIALFINATNAARSLCYRYLDALERVNQQWLRI